MRPTPKETLFEIGMEANHLRNALSEELATLAPPQDPEELAYREELREELEIYRHLDWLVRTELSH